MRPRGHRPVGRAERGRRLAALFGVAAIAFAAACDQPPESAGTAEIPGGPDSLPPPDQVVEDGEHVITLEGVKKAVLVAEQLYFYNDTSTVIGDTIQVSFFGDGGEFVSMLTARTGVINQRTQQMTAYGDVHVRSPDSRIETEELHYEPEEDRIWSDQPTRIDQQGNLIRGQGVESDPGLKEIRIRGGSAVLRSEPDVGPTPRADTTGQAAPPPPERQQVAPPSETPPDGDAGGGADPDAAEEPAGDGGESPDADA